MNDYLLIKTIHIISSVLLVGTGFGSAFYLYFVNRSHNLAAIVVVSHLVIRADWWFTTPAVIVQPISGYWMIQMAGWPLSTPWIALSLALYALAGLCWLPVVLLQIKMHKMAEQCLSQGNELPAQYWTWARYWEWLGYPAFIAMIGVYYLMVNKPFM